MKETIAQEAKRLLSPIPEDQWIAGRFTDEKGRCCGRGHWVRLHSENPDNYDSYNCIDTLDGSDKRLADAASAFLKARNPRAFKRYEPLAGVNDGWTTIYRQKTPKRRVIKLLDDMIAAGL